MAMRVCNPFLLDQCLIAIAAGPQSRSQSPRLAARSPTLARRSATDPATPRGPPTPLTWFSPPPPGREYTK